MKPTKIAVSTPCYNCPFRADRLPFLRAARVREIWNGAKFGDHFVCHETVDYNAPRGKDFGRRACAGFLIVAQRSDYYFGLTVVQLAERLAGVSFDLRGQESCYLSAAAMIEAHDRAEATPPRRARQ